ncbi:metallophosphoesterase family protein [Acidicapsa ligni]|uniref:metallophosphoesterase family protein n=1 Tax=Acidicapsa ligni TaxID=542300 RepID=UPI0021E0A33D|nr:metallophosphoesterase family protein [Acidicapsa ligni]
MRIAIISDVHANFPALRAFSETWDELWVIGDLVNYGPNPNEVIDWVQTHAHCVVRGNHDHAIGFSTDPRCSAPYRAMASETGAFTNKVLSEQSKRYLERLPLTVERRLREHTFYLVHATPSDPLFGYLDKDAPQWDDEVRATGANIVVTGHTHVPFIRTVDNQTLINPGSIGQPKTGTPDACYAIWEDGSLELRRYAYPVADTESEIRAMPISESVKADLIQSLRTGGVSAKQVSG